MSRQHHHLKCETEYFQATECGDKRFEIRKNDRDYKRYDMIYLNEVVNGIATGRTNGPYEVRYIMYGGKFGLDKDCCVMQLRYAVVS